MPKPTQCRLIGGISIVLGLAVLVVSALLLNILTKHYCSGGYEGSFEYHGEDGGVHGGHSSPSGYRHKVTKDPKYFEAYTDRKESGYKKDGSGESSLYSKSYYYCHSVPLKLKACAGVGLAAAILQILISVIYCCANKKNVKLFSGLWAGAHFLVIVALVAAFSIVLSLKWPKDKDQDQKYDNLKYVQPKALAFSAVAGLNVIALILLMIFVVATFKKSDYDDYSVGYEKDDQPVVASK